MTTPIAGNPLITAVRIWDGGDPNVPLAMLPNGVEYDAAIDQIAAKGQMQGTNLERLGEIASRICYDSLGTGRSSADFHKNIIKVNHLSVYEHCVFTVNIHTRRHEEVAEYACLFLNMPTMFVRQTTPYDLRVTLNLRHVREWSKPRHGVFVDPTLVAAFGQALNALANEQAPMIMNGVGFVVESRERDGRMEVTVPGTYSTMKVVEATVPMEQWITLLMTGSRGFSHELVRHGDWTAISQRSTRYVDENVSPWVEHPLLTQFKVEADTVPRASNGEKTELSVADRGNHVEGEAKRTYAIMVAKLEAWLIAKGVDKFTARKQARGAARGYLGNALLTEVVFSANVQQWKHMLGMRACQAADAEIREAFCKALPELQGSRYGAAFAGYKLAPAPDGIGQIVVEKA